MELLPHQLEIINDTDTRYLGLIGGYGSAKSYTAYAKAIQLAYLNVGFRGVILAPTNTLAADVTVPEFEDMLIDEEISYDLKVSPLPSFYLHFEEGTSQILIRSGENYRRIVGLNLAWAIFDEIDTLNKDVADKAWKKVVGRLRAQAPCIQALVTTTPEGFGWAYNYFVKEVEIAIRAGKPKKNRRFITASTYDNPFLESDYIDSLLEEYPENLIQAYLHGKFVNLTANSVYPDFDRKICNTTKTIDNFPQHYLHIGVDFNIGKTTGVVIIIDKGIPYILDEITGQRDVVELINTINERYGNRAKFIYPDASGVQERANAGKSEIVQLVTAFGRQYIKYRKQHPRVKDRVASVNAVIKNGKGVRKLQVNIEKCPITTDSFEQQVYTKAGEPDKEHDNDHPMDATGYCLFFRMPIQTKGKIRSTR